MPFTTHRRGFNPLVSLTLALVVSIFIPSESAFGQAQLPLVFLDTTYSPPPIPPGQRITVLAGGDFQAALDQAQSGDIIELEAGATFTGNFILRKKVCPPTAISCWTYIQSTGTLPPPGTRVIPCDATLPVTSPPLVCNVNGSAVPATRLPKLMTPNASPVLKPDEGAHHYRFVGIEFAPNPGVVVVDVISLGTALEATADLLPHHIVFDRSYIRGDPKVETLRGITFNSESTAVVDSYLSNFKHLSADAMAIGGWNGPGPFKIANSYLEGAGENVIFGGADPSISNLVPSDIEIRGNHFYKPLR